MHPTTIKRYRIIYLNNLIEHAINGNSNVAELFQFFEWTQHNRQVSPKAKTVFEYVRLPMPEWLATIYLKGADNGEISAERLFKLVGEAFPIAEGMLMIYRDHGGRKQEYWLTGLIEVDDTILEGRKPKKMSMEPLTYQLFFRRIENEK